MFHVTNLEHSAEIFLHNILKYNYSNSILHRGKKNGQPQYQLMSTKIARQDSNVFRAYRNKNYTYGKP